MIQAFVYVKKNHNIYEYVGDVCRNAKIYILIVMMIITRSYNAVEII